MTASNQVVEFGLGLTPEEARMFGVQLGDEAGQVRNLAGWLGDEAFIDLANTKEPMLVRVYVGANANATGLAFLSALMFLAAGNLEIKTIQDRHTGAIETVHAGNLFQEKSQLVS